MSRLRFLTSGESHGKGLTGTIEGIPANLSLAASDIDQELSRRQGGFGRGGRMKIESDRAEIISGVRWGKTIGSPITLFIENRDYANWSEGMSSLAKSQGSIPPVTKARPGHADLAGAIKYDQRDIRNILERSSARETASRVALGAVAKRFLSEFGITIGSYVVRIGDATSASERDTGDPVSLLSLFRKAELSPVRCPDDEGSKRMIEAIEQAGSEGTTLGGVFEIFATGVPPGLGSHAHWDRRIEGLLAQAVMCVQAIKGVEIGDGFTMAGLSGSQVMDEIFYVPSHFSRKTNHAGGIEGGMTNGMPVLVRAAMKPIPTLRKPLRSVDIATKEAVEAAYERSDVCAVPAASVVGEAMAALVLADSLLEKFGGDSMEEVQRNYRTYLEYVGKF